MHVGDVTLISVSQVADHVEADEAHAATYEFGADLGCDPAVALGQRHRRRCGLLRQVAVEVVALRNARERISNT